VKKKKGKYPRFSGGDDMKTKPDLRRQPARKKTHAHDDFEIEIDVAEFDPEETVLDEPLYTGESAITDQMIAPQDEDDIQTKQMDVANLDLELPRSSAEEILPVYRSSRESHKPEPKQQMPPPKAPFPQTPLPSSDKQDILELFDDPENASLSVELPPVSDFKRPKPATPLGEPDEFEIVRPGQTTGVSPLDGDQFDSRPIPRKKKKGQKWLGPTAPLPMAYSEQVVSRRFSFGLKHFILVLLILIVAAALVLGWFIYQDYRERQNLKEMAKGSELIEKSKDEAIQGSARKKNGDIPYKGKIEKPQGGKSGGEK
jgi:hypothetical protein